MIAEGTDAKNVTDDQIKQVADDVELFRRASKISRKVIAKAIGVSQGVVSEFLAGKYAGNRGSIAIQLQSWLVEEEARASRPQTTQFVWTNVAMEIKATAMYCRDFRKIGLVYGPDTSGIGKTTALRAIHEELGPRMSTLVTIDKVDANPTGVLRKICQAMHIQDNGSNRNRFTRLVDRLKGRAHLLIIDQIHNLRLAKDDKPFYILTDLHDATEATNSQLWCGTADLVTYLTRQQAKSADESLAQIRRRIFPCVDLMESLRAGGGGGGDPLVDVEQVREMFAKNKMKLTPTAARFLCTLANLPDSGGVGLCVQIVEYATMMAEMRNLKSIDAELLKEAMSRGFSPHRAELIMHRLDTETAPRIARSA